ncbi:MAG: alpha-glucan family phosphorylase [Candidatus Omnitrophica bacterium]|nr:alpha-glucan family phosphorylase [Candidatus Omnitrophota bacterium]
MNNNKQLEEFLSLVKVENFEERYKEDISEGLYFGLPLQPIIEAEKRLISSQDRNIAYFSMEYGLATSFYNLFSSSHPISESNKSQDHEVCSNYTLADYFFTINTNSIVDLPIYSGGLGVLAGDTVKTMADYKLPAVCFGVLWNSGYFRQRLWFKYGQFPEAMPWDLKSYPGLIPLKNRVKISLKSEDIYLRLWKYYVYSYDKSYAVPLILLDSNLEENGEKNRHLTDQLYRSESGWIKIMQRLILGMGGVSALRELDYKIDLHHLNEGHAVFAYVEKARGLSPEQREELKKHFAYTCHTPVDAGHDRFSVQELYSILNPEDFELVDANGKDKGNLVNLTLLAMNVSGHINAVSKAHQKVMHLQFPKYMERIQFVTNGVHHHTWTSERFKAISEKFKPVFGDIKANPMALIKAQQLSTNPEFRQAVWKAHQENKSEFCNFLEKWKLDKDAFTVCWARRIAAYKRPSLILQDIERLVDVAKRCGPIQVIFAGKAHPKDNLGFTYINQILEKVDGMTGVYDYLKIILLENYDITLAKTLVSSVDVWLNNPLPPFEASGTSGMKAILNAVVQMSTVDGWVAEAQDMEIGKFFGYRSKEDELGHELNLRLKEDSDELYSGLEELVTLYYKTNNKGTVDLNSKWIDMMINCIACGSRFNTYRMLDQYKSQIWGIA